jgi:hypothetical protein
MGLIVNSKKGKGKGNVTVSAVPPRVTRHGGSNKK